MAIMTAASAKERLSKLKDRTLWYDGDSTVSEEFITEVISRGQSTEGLFVPEMTANIEQYNKLVSPDQRIGIKTAVVKANLEFTIPDEFLKLDVAEYIADKLTLELKSHNFTPIERAKRATRTLSELALYQNLGLTNVLKTLIYIINTLQDNKIVWGVGRGSSVSSYVLYLIGVHDVDSVRYDLDIEDFLRSE